MLPSIRTKSIFSGTAIRCCYLPLICVIWLWVLAECSLAIDGNWVKVTASPGKIMDGTSVLQEMKQGTELWVHEVRDDGWAKVHAWDHNRMGWMHQRDFLPVVYSSQQQRILKQADDLYSEYLKLKKADDVDAAVEKLKEAIALSKPILGDRHTKLLSREESLAFRLSGQRKTREALEILEPNISVWEQTLGQHHPDLLRAIYNQGLWLHRLKKYEQAYDVRTDSLERRRQHYGDSHQKTLDAIDGLADSAEKIGKHQLAYELRTELLSAYENTKPDLDEDRVSAMEDVADSLFRLEKTQEARAMYDDLLQSLRDAHGPHHADVYDTMAQYAYALSAADLHDDALQMKRELLDGRRKLLGEDHENTLWAMESLAYEWNNGPYVDFEHQKECLRLRRIVAEKRRQQSGDNHPDTIQAVERLVTALELPGNATDHGDEILTHRHFLLEQIESRHGAEDSQTLTAHINLAKAQKSHGNGFEARQECDRILDICWKDPGEHQESISAVLALLRELNDVGAYLSVARKNFRLMRELDGLETRRCIDLACGLVRLELEIGGEKRVRNLCEELVPFMVRYLETLSSESKSFNATNYGIILHKAGMKKESRRFLKLAFESASELERVSEIDLLNYGGSLFDAGETEEGLQMLKQAVERCLTQNYTSQVLPTCYSAYADALAEVDNLDELKRLAAQLSESARTLLATHDPGVLRQLNGAAHSLAKGQQHDVALDILDRSFSRLLEMVGPLHQDVLSGREIGIEVLCRMGKFSDALQTAHQNRIAIRQYVAELLPMLTPQEQLQFLANKDQERLERALSLAVKLKDDPQTATLSAQWLLNSKAIAQEAVAEATLVSKPRTAPLVRELQGVRSQLASMQHSNLSAADRDRIAELEARRQTLYRKLSSAGLRLTSEDSWISLALVRDQIAPDEVLIDIVRLTLRDVVTGEPQGAEYFAWVIPAIDEGRVKIVSLGNAGPIDQLIAKARQALTTAPELSDRATEQFTAATLDISRELSTKLLGPLNPFLQGKRRVMICPDGELWKLPWAALPTDDDRFLIEQLQVDYLSSTRDLLEDSQYRGGVGAAVVLADPDFDHAPDSPEQQLQTAQVYAAKSRHAGSIGTAQRLPGTRVEAEAIRQAMSESLKQEPEIFLDSKASESTFKNVFRPRVLVISTHGFFLQNELTSAEAVDQASKSQAETSRLFENPLLRCGLLLAGCNLNRTDIDDGILTGLEIVSTDLRGTELVVLSACDTGLGDVQNGQGIAGLRQAFQLAGAKAVVASLWQVSDRETALLISDFFRNLADEDSKPAALRSAQLSRIKKLRSRFGAAHPYYWAAFTVTSAR